MEFDASGYVEVTDWQPTPSSCWDNFLLTWVTTTSYNMTYILRSYYIFNINYISCKNLKALSELVNTLNLQDWLLLGNRAHVNSCQIYFSCLTSFRCRTCIFACPSEDGPLSCLLYLSSRDEAIKHITDRNLAVPKARLWDENSHICPLNTVHLVGVIWHMAQTRPVYWAQSVWAW